MSSCSEIPATMIARAERWSNDRREFIGLSTAHWHGPLQWAQQPKNIPHSCLTVFPATSLGRNAMRLLYFICLFAAAAVTSVAAADNDPKLKQEIESINAA